jgi:hypothetical protein
MYDLKKHPQRPEIGTAEWGVYLIRREIEGTERYMLWRGRIRTNAQEIRNTMADVVEELIDAQTIIMIAMGCKPLPWYDRWIARGFIFLMRQMVGAIYLVRRLFPKNWREDADADKGL